MHPAGAWTIIAPRARRAAAASFIRGAISATRAAADVQWCASHMSHRTTAARAASQSRRMTVSGGSASAARTRRTSPLPLIGSSNEVGRVPAGGCGRGVRHAGPATRRPT
jgi:hypothetical protein